MKSALIPGIIIGILSGLWLFVMHWTGNDLHADKASPFEYVSVLIPLIVLYFGVRSFRAQNGGVISFFEALVECFKILLIGGVIAVFVAILYINYIQAGNNIQDFSGRMFGALLVGLAFSLAISVTLMNKSKRL